MKKNNQELYDKMNNFFESTNIAFMNHGYHPPYDFISSEYLEFKNQASLYFRLFEKINPNNKSILEIGCGRGGGINALTKNFNFNSVDACDLNNLNIEYCNNNNKNNIKFKISDAQNLDYSDNSFDIIINVESSHCYDNLGLFYKEVKRVLKPNGIFLYTDCAGPIHSDFPKYFNLYKYINRIDLTENVKNSCLNDIENFKKINKSEKIKEYLVELATNKYREYSVQNNLFIFYACSDNEEWFN